MNPATAGSTQPKPYSLNGMAPIIADKNGMFTTELNASIKLTTRVKNTPHLYEAVFGIYLWNKPANAKTIHVGYNPKNNGVEINTILSTPNKAMAAPIMQNNKADFL